MGHKGARAKDANGAPPVSMQSWWRLIAIVSLALSLFFFSFLFSEKGNFGTHEDLQRLLAKFKSISGNHK